MTISSPQMCLLHQLILFFPRITECKNCSSRSPYSIHFWKFNPTSLLYLIFTSCTNTINGINHQTLTLITITSHTELHKNGPSRARQTWEVIYLNLIDFMPQIEAITSSKKAMVAMVSCSLYVECANLCFHVFYYCKKEKFYI